MLNGVLVSNYVLHDMMCFGQAQAEQKEQVTESQIKPFTEPEIPNKHTVEGIK